MNVDGKHYRSIWVDPDDRNTIRIIDQRQLPYAFNIEELTTVDGMAQAIRDMHLRGAGLIGAAAGYGMYLAALEASSEPSFDRHLTKSAATLTATRPTAVNLTWAIKRQLAEIGKGRDAEEKTGIAFRTARAIADEDADHCQKIGQHGLGIIKGIGNRKDGDRINILTHCNAGWLAFVDHGTATAPIYAAFDSGLDVHVWVDETRPRNQGARLTAWELQQHGVPHTVITDNLGGHLMQQGLVDMVITGSDRTTYTGDVANKIGTYLKALAAKDNAIPFYVALPSSSFDWEARDGCRDIEIENRHGNEVRYMQGLCDNELKEVLLTPPSSPVVNYAFDVTPARLVTSLITERGICNADETDILRLFPEQRKGLLTEGD